MVGTTGFRLTAGKAAVLIAALFALMVTPATVTASATDANTANGVCDISNKQLFDGTQNKDGSCVTTDLGEVPDINKMTSTVIRFPRDDATLRANQAFVIRTKTINLTTGFFSDPVKQYLVFSQTLDNAGFIQGHSHVTIQRIANQDEPLDPRIFAFFKELGDPADGSGELTAPVDKGLPVGRYRLCTMVSAFSHQPVTMPVAQRGAQDDCVRFRVTVLGLPLP